MSTTQLPETCKALVCETIGQPLVVKDVPTPQPGPGSVIVKVVASIVDNMNKAIFSGYIPFLQWPTPFIPGARAVGRIAAVGPDTTTLQVGQLVITEPFTKGRDNADAQILFGLSYMQGEPSKRLMTEMWNNGVYTEYARIPLENCWPLDEKVLLGSKADGGLGYDINDLPYISKQLVPFGGWHKLGLKAGERVIIAPATGGFSGAAVECASAMGANVIAAGRNVEVLKKMAATIPRVNYVQLTGDIQADAQAFQKFGRVDAFMDISPVQVKNPTHITSAIMALKPGGRMALMGGITENISLPYVLIMSKNLTIKGQFMYDREAASDIIRLAESGLLKLGKEAHNEIVGTFNLDQWQEAFDVAEKNAARGQIVLFTH